MEPGLLRMVDAVTVKVSDLDDGPRFYCDVLDPFGNVLVLVDLSKGRYETDERGSVIGVS